MVYHRFKDDFHQLTAGSFSTLFITLGSPVGGGGFNHSRAFRRAWDVGPGALGQGTSRNVAWELGLGGAWFGKPLGCLLELSWGAF